tara:strand:- start:142 stop:867 length:726 start_codon:yes stop_codon:yes gene_type:complete
MRVLVFQHFHKLPNSTNLKTRVSRLNNLLNEKCIASIKKYCQLNNYDYYLSDKTLGWNYFNKKFNNLCLERYVLASLKAAEGNYEIIAIVDHDFLAISDEPLPYCPGFAGFHNVSFNRFTKPVVPTKYHNFLFCTGITLWWREHLHDFAKYLNEIAGLAGTHERLLMTCLKIHQESFLTHFLESNQHINIAKLDYRFNIKSFLTHHAQMEKHTFIHLQGPYHVKLNTFKHLPKEIRAKILR